MRRLLAMRFIFLLTIVSASHYQTPLHCPSNHIYHDPKLGLIKEFEAANELECMSVCDDTTGCVSYNIELPDLVCEFNDDKTNAYGDDMVPRDGWTYWEKLDDWEISDTCSFNYLDGRKQREVTARVSDTLIETRGSALGWWGKDTGLNDSRVYYVPDYHGENYVYGYYTEEDFIANNVNYVRHSISPSATGNSWIVHKRKFWYREHDVARLVIWNFDTDVLEETINIEVMGQTYGPTYKQCQYDSGREGVVDFEVDEMGRMFMIWGDANMECTLRISVIDTKEYRITRTIGIEGMIRSSGGNGFIVDDIYYMTDNYHAQPTWIMVEWNFRNSSTFFRQTGPAGISNALPWPQPHGYNGNLHWNPIDQKLYSTHHGKHYRSNLTFRDLP